MNADHAPLKMLAEFTTICIISKVIACFFVFCFNPNFGPAAISLHKICYGFSVFFSVWDKDGGDLGLILHFSGSCVVELSLMKNVRWTQELWMVVG